MPDAARCEGRCSVLRKATQHAAKSDPARCIRTPPLQAYLNKKMGNLTAAHFSSFSRCFERNFVPHGTIDCFNKQLFVFIVEMIILEVC